MPAPNWTAPGVLEVAILGEWSNGRPVVNVLHLTFSGVDPVTRCREALNGWQDWVLDFVADNYRLTGARFRDRSVAAGAVGFLPPDPAKPVNGALVSASATPNVATLVHKVSTLTVGQRPGRMFLPPMADVSIDENGLIDPASVAAGNVAMAGALNVWETGVGNELVTVHFQGPADASGTTTVVTDLIVDGRAATQRRRLRK